MTTKEIVSKFILKTFPNIDIHDTKFWLPDPAESEYSKAVYYIFIVFF